MRKQTRLMDDALHRRYLKLAVACLLFSLIAPLSLAAVASEESLPTVPEDLHLPVSEEPLQQAPDATPLPLSEESLAAPDDKSLPSIAQASQEQPADEPPLPITEELLEQTAEEPPLPIAEELLEQPADEPPLPIAVELLEQPADEAPPSIAEESLEQPADEAPPSIAEESLEQPADEPPPSIAEESLEQRADEQLPPIALDSLTQPPDEPLITVGMPLPMDDQHAEGQEAALTVETDTDAVAPADDAQANKPEPPPAAGINNDVASETVLPEAPLSPELPLPDSVVTEAEAPIPAETPNGFRILGTEVISGTTARLSWEPNDNFMGISAPTTVLVTNGVKPGPTLCLTSAVHGDELNGIEIVREVFYGLNPEDLAGVLVAVPIVNLQGFRRGQRYLPDRRDLNRYFPGDPKGSAASRIAHSLFQEVISHCSYLVDLHTGSFRRTNLPQLRVDLSNEPVAELARKMGNIAIVHSVGSSGTLRRNAVENGIPTVTLEVGEPHLINGSAIEQGTRSIRALLAALDMTKLSGYRDSRSGPEFINTRWVRTIEGGILMSRATLGDNVKKGQMLGTVTDPITNARYDLVSNFNGKVIGMALDQVMYPGYAAYHIGLRPPRRKSDKLEALENVLLEGDLVATDGGPMIDPAATGSADSEELPAEREFDIPFFDELSTDTDVPASREIED